MGEGVEYAGEDRGVEFSWWFGDAVRGGGRGGALLGLGGGNRRTAA